MKMPNLSQLLVFFIFLFVIPSPSLSDECAGTGQGSVEITNISPGPGDQPIEKGKWITFSGTLTYSVNSGYGHVNLSVLSVNPPVLIKTIDLNQAEGTVEFNADAKIDSAIQGTLDSFSIRAVLYHPDYTCTSILDHTESYQVSGNGSYCDLRDVTNILQISGGLSPFCYRSYDFDSSGKVDLVDAVSMLQYIAGLR